MACTSVDKFRLKMGLVLLESNDKYRAKARCNITGSRKVERKVL